MQISYHRLTADDREEVSRGIEAGRSYATIAHCIGRPTCTVSREVERNGGRLSYRALRAERYAQKHSSGRKSGKRKIFSHTPLRCFVHRHLRKKWSPEQISAALKKAYPFVMTMHISDEAMYQYLYVLPKGELRKTLIKGLRQQRAFRIKRKRKDEITEERRGKIADMLSIEERPLEVLQRIVPGHWEGDTILGKHRHSMLGTLVERTTRYTLLVPLLHKDSGSVRRAFAQSVLTLPAELRKTLTYDQGREMSEHIRFTVDTGMTVYFAHPGAPWERGTNENTNMLIRHYFPKGTDFRMITRQTIKAAQRSLNERPRKTLGWRTPREALQTLLR